MCEFEFDEKDDLLVHIGYTNAMLSFRAYSAEFNYTYPHYPQIVLCANREDAYELVAAHVREHSSGPTEKISKVWRIAAATSTTSAEAKLQIGDFSFLPLIYGRKFGHSHWALAASVAIILAGYDLDE